MRRWSLSDFSDRETLVSVLLRNSERKTAAHLPRVLYFGNLQDAMDLSPLVGDLICTVHSPPGKWNPFDEATPVICAQAFLASALGRSIVAMTAYLRLDTWHGAVNKPVLSIILQTRKALFTASSAAIAELAPTSMVAAAKNSFIENPDPLRQHGARAGFVLQDMSRGFPLAI